MKALALAALSEERGSGTVGGDEMQVGKPLEPNELASVVTRRDGRPDHESDRAASAISPSFQRQPQAQQMPRRLPIVDVARARVDDRVIAHQLDVAGP